MVWSLVILITSPDSILGSCSVEVYIIIGTMTLHLSLFILTVILNYLLEVLLHSLLCEEILLFSWEVAIDYSLLYEHIHIVSWMWRLNLKTQKRINRSDWP